MDNGTDTSMADQPVKRLGRPRKSLPDAGSVEAISDLPTECSGHGETVDGIESGAIFDPWPAVSALALKVSESGLMVTQLHTTGQGQRWQFWDIGAATHSHSDGNYVVTSDGVRHTL